MKLLIVEDNPTLLDALTTGLRRQGFEVASARTYADAWLRMVLGSYSVIVLDVLLPGGTGMDLCRRARARNITTPILMLTARDGIEDRVYGLELGADDYLTKPFAFEELVARVHALARRPAALAPLQRTCGDLVVDLQKRRVTRAGGEIELTAKEFALLELFLQHEGQIVDRAQILAYVWDENYDPRSNTVEVLVRRLREKIGAGHGPPLIHTLRGAGYRFGN